MRKLLSVVVAILLLAATFTTVYATDNSQAFLFELTADGKSTIEVHKEDVITVAFRLRRTDATEAYTMYAMQNEICYDGNFFELVEDSAVLKTDVVFSDIGLVDQHRELYMNYLSMSGGQRWSEEEIVGTVQLRVIAESGTTVVENQNYLVSTRDGMDRYAGEATDLVVVLSTDCTVEFDSNGGSQVPSQIVQFGEKIQEPEIPTRDGYDFAGWYKDIFLKETWNFDEDVVEGNMRLYAKWTPQDQVETTEAENGPAEEIPQGASGQTYKWMVLILTLVVICLAVVLVCKKKKHTSET